MAFLAHAWLKSNLARLPLVSGTWIADLDYEQLEALGKEVVGFDKVAQLTEWLCSSSPNNPNTA